MNSIKSQRAVLRVVLVGGSTDSCQTARAKNPGPRAYEGQRYAKGSVSDSKLLVRVRTS